MSKPMSRAIKFRDQMLTDLASRLSTLVWNRDDGYARDVEGRIKQAFPFYIDPEAVAFLEEGTRKLTDEDFYNAISALRLPFPSVWLELDVETPEGYLGARLGAIIDVAEDRLRVYPAKLLRLPGKTYNTILHSGSEVAFLVDGRVELSDTPAARLLDIVTEGRKGRYRQDLPLDEIIQLDTVQEREGEAFGIAVRCVALLLAISGLHKRRDLLEVDDPQPTNKRVAKQYTQRDSVAPAFDLTMIRLGRAGRAQAVADAAESTDEDRRKRPAHWVRGHFFLARNGKLTWRNRHVRGEGVPQVKPRVATA